MKGNNVKKKKRRKKHYLLRLILLIAMGTGIYFFLTSSLFEIQKLTVRDNEHYTASEIISIAKPDIGGNLFKTSVNEMKDKLLNDPYIKNARISKKLPDELVITVAERKETASVPYGESYIVIDKEGMILRHAKEPPALTMLTGMTLTNIQTGTLLETEKESMLSDSLDILKSMEENELFFKKIVFSGILVNVYIYDNLICKGSPENILKSMDELKDVLYDLFVQGIERGVIKVGGDGYFSFSALVE